MSLILRFETLFASDDNEEEINEVDEQLDVKIKNVNALVPVDEGVDTFGVFPVITVILSDHKIMK